MSTSSWVQSNRPIVGKRADWDGVLLPKLLANVCCVLRGLARSVTGGRVRLLVVAALLAVFAAAHAVAYLLRFDLELPPHYELLLLGSLPFVVLVKLLCFYAARVFRIMWAFLGIADVLRVGRAVIASGLALFALSRFGGVGLDVPRSILLLDPILTFLGTTFVFAMLQLVREAAARQRMLPLGVERVFIVGAGDAGETLLRELQRRSDLGLRVAGFLDDDPALIGRTLRGVPVLGPVGRVGQLSRSRGVRRVILAIPSLSAADRRAMLRCLAESDVAIKLLPPLHQLAGGDLAVQLRDVDVLDLLHRPPVRLSPEPLRAFLCGKRVLVTGAAGSIGSEICRQVLRQDPEALIALDSAETPLHDLDLELQTAVRSSRARVTTVLADIVDLRALQRIFDATRPDVVFHAAAVKHVPVLESDPERAVAVNVGGTRKLARLAAGYASAFVLVSTDKAVRPTSVMGATKRVAEMVVMEAQSRYPECRFACVRFGNVLGSNGSVVPLFKRQIAAGGPVTLTHPDMRRYFMTIAEATELVLHAGAQGRGGEVFVLDMGEPVRILSLASDLIRLSGLRPDEDIKIEFTGVRPGEKLFEEWAMDPQWVSPTATPRLFVVREPDPPLSGADRERLEQASGRREILEHLQRLIPDYSPYVPPPVVQPAAAGAPLVTRIQAVSEA